MGAINDSSPPAPRPGEPRSVAESASRNHGDDRSLVSGGSQGAEPPVRSQWPEPVVVRCSPLKVGKR